MTLELFLFSHDLEYAPRAIEAGFDAIVVDWEWRGKDARQAGRATEVNRGTERDLADMRRLIRAKVFCRINNDSWSARRDEAIRAADMGADEVLLPMVRSLDEVDDCLSVLPRDCALGVMVETREALTLGPGLSARSLARCFVGLNDLHIELGAPHIFTPLCDGAVEGFRRAFDGHFGVAGVTRPTGGAPVPCRLLLAEMARLGCAFAVARRSFRADVPMADLPTAVFEIRTAYAQLLGRSSEEIAEDRRTLQALVAGLQGRLSHTAREQEP